MALLEIARNFKDEQIEHGTEYTFSTVEQSSDIQDQDYKSQTFDHRDLIPRSQIIAVMINR